MSTTLLKLISRSTTPLVAKAHVVLRRRSLRELISRSTMSLLAEAHVVLRRRSRPELISRSTTPLAAKTHYCAGDGLQCPAIKGRRLPVMVSVVRKETRYSDSVKPAL